MRVVYIKTSDTMCKVTFSCETPSLVLQAIVIGIRRVILSEVPILAMDGYSVYKNESIMPNEVLAHRIELVPMKSDVVEYIADYPSCDCHTSVVNLDGCSKCTIMCRLTVTAGDTETVVTSGDIRLSADAATWTTSPVHACIPLVTLNPGKRIDFDLCYRKGIGMYHAKWAPAHVLYRIIKPKQEYTLDIDSTGCLDGKAILVSAVDVLIQKFVALKVQFGMLY